MLSEPIRKRYHTTLGTSVINYLSDYKYIFFSRLRGWAKIQLCWPSIWSTTQSIRWVQFLLENPTGVRIITIKPKKIDFTRYINYNDCRVLTLWYHQNCMYVYLLLKTLIPRLFQYNHYSSLINLFHWFILFWSVFKQDTFIISFIVGFTSKEVFLITTFFD